jgi:murein DD-endopeptidase MepM/ murein hydrolase activator NlpD
VLAAGVLLAAATRTWRQRTASPPPPAIPAEPSGNGLPLPTGLGPLSPPVPGARNLVGFGWTERAGRPVFQPYLRLEAPPGAEVRAVAPGVVRAVHHDPAGLGLHVVVGHALGWSSLYGGCGSVLVRPGEAVAAGQPVCALPPHPAPAQAVFGLLRGDHPVDPEPYLGGR